MVYFSTEQYGRNVKWNSARDYEQHEYMGNVPLFYIFKSFIKLKDQFEKNIYSLISILCPSLLYDLPYPAISIPTVHLNVKKTDSFQLQKLFK